MLEEETTILQITLNSIESYNPNHAMDKLHGIFPENIYAADAVVLDGIVYVIGGRNGSSYSNKVFAADLNASVAGVYDLYRKDNNQSHSRSRHTIRFGSGGWIGDGE